METPSNQSFQTTRSREDAIHNIGPVLRSSSHDTDYIPVHEKLAQLRNLHNQEHVQERTDLLVPIINNLFPGEENSNPYISQPWGVADSEWEEMKKPGYQQRELANIIAKTNTANTKLEAYATTLAQLAKSTKSSKFTTNIDEAKGWANRSESIERLYQWQTVYDQWQQNFFRGTSDIQNEKMVFQAVVNRFCQRGENQEILPTKLTVEELSSFIPIATSLRQRALHKPDNSRIFLPGEDEALSLGITFHDPEQTKMMLELVRESSGVDRNILNEYYHIIQNYSIFHGGLSDNLQNGFRENILPRMINHDPSTEIFFMPAGERVTLDGLPKLVVKSFTEEITPGNINELFMLSKHIAGKDVVTFEQNRYDGIDLTRIFHGLQSIIHDHGWEGYNLVKTMIHYYETYHDAAPSSQPELRLLLSKLFFRLDEEHLQQIIEPYTDHRNYDKSIITRKVLPDGSTVQERKTAIDTLHRLEINTQPVNQESPNIPDTQLHTVLKKLEQTTDIYDKRHLLEEACSYINRSLLQKMSDKKIGIEPETILAIAWIDTQATSVLQNISFEDQYTHTVYRDAWFQELLKFQELTSFANEFNETEFENFLSVVSQASSQDSYKIIAERIAKNIAPLVKTYTKQKKVAWIESLRGGSVRELTEILPFTDKTPASLWGEFAASTKRALALKKEREKEPNYHQGD